VILFIDSETIPSLRPDVYAYLAAKHYDHGDVEKAAKKAADEHGKTSLSGLFGELAVISFAVDDAEPVTLVRDLANVGGERAVLVDFTERLSKLNPPTKIVAHNADFDRHMIRQRGIVQSVRLPPAFAATDVKPWESRWVCTMALWTDDRRGRVGLDALCLALGVPGKFFDSSLVAEMVRAGRIEEVAAHCANDVRCLRGVYQRMTGVL